jgi:hypothetical protein
MKIIVDIHPINEVHMKSRLRKQIERDLNSKKSGLRYLRKDRVKGREKEIRKLTKVLEKGSFKKLI